MELTLKTIKRPIHLDLFTMKFPPMAIVSILHRLSGVVIFILLPLALYLLHSSLDLKGFTLVQTWMMWWPMKLAVWMFLSALALHWLAGFRHMMMDCGVAESLKSGRISAYVIFVLAAIVIILLGAWLW